MGGGVSMVAAGVGLLLADRGGAAAGMRNVPIALVWSAHGAVSIWALQGLPRLCRERDVSPFVADVAAFCIAGTSVLAPRMATDIGAQFMKWVFALDASPARGESVRTQETPEVVREMWRLRDRRGTRAEVAGLVDDGNSPPPPASLCRHDVVIVIPEENSEKS